MIVSAQGMPGAGKTTILQELAELSSSYTYVPETVLPMPDSPDDDFFIQNDLAKYDMARGTATHLLDRDFLSTVAFANTRDGEGSQTARVSRIIDGHLEAGNLTLPNLFLHFTVDFPTSVRRQNPLNPPFWKDEGFLSQFETHLSVAIGRYIIANNVRYEIIHGTDDKQVIKNSVASIITELA